MSRLSWVVVFGVAFAAAFLAGGLLYPAPVPVAGAVQLTGTAVPATGSTSDGFFIVPPRVVDFSDFDPDDLDDDLGDDDDHEDGSSLIRPIAPVASLDDDDAPDDSDGRSGNGNGSPDDSPDDDPDDSPDDSIDDDD